MGFLGLFGKKEKTGAMGMKETVSSGKAIDPVCGMEVDEKKAAGKSEYNGKTYYFCSLACKKSFDQDPAKYTGAPAAAHGGHKM